MDTKRIEIKESGRAEICIRTNDETKILFVRGPAKLDIVINKRG